MELRQFSTPPKLDAEVSYKIRKSNFNLSIHKSRFSLTKQEEQHIQDYKSNKIQPSPYLQRYKKTSKEQQSSSLEGSLKLLDLKNEDLPPHFMDMLGHASRLSSTIYAGNIKPQEKSLYFSLLSLSLLEEDGIVVVVTPNHSYLKEKFRRINNLVNWAAINSQVDQTQKENVISHLDSGNVRLFLVHPEYLGCFQAHQVSVLVLDEAQSYTPELGFPNTLWQPNMSKFIEEVNPKAIQIFMPQISTNSLTQLVSDPPYPYQFFGIHESTKSLMNPLTSTRDEDPLKSVTQLLRSQRLFRKNGILVFASSRIEVEETSTFLTSNGFKCGSLLTTTCETKRQAVLYDFAKNSIDILVLPSGLLLPEGFKSFIYLTIHINIPLSLEVMMNDISELNCQANSHVFLDQNDFIRQRNSISSSFMNIKSIDKFLSNLLGTEEKQTKQIKVLIRLYMFIKINETLAQFDISRDNFYSIINELVKCEWLTIKMTVPSEILIKIPNKEQNLDPFVNTIKYLQIKISILTRNGKRLIQSRQVTQDITYRCQMNMIRLESGYTVKEVLQNLKRLQLKKYLSYQILEEIIYFEVQSDRTQFEAKVIEIYTQLQRVTHQELLKLDQVWSVLRVTSFKTLEHMWRQVKLKDNQIQTNMDSYFQMNSHPLVELPFINLNTQREKSNVLSDVKIILDDLSVECVMDRWIERESFATDAIVILQGLSSNVWSTSWKSSNIWKKYEKYKYESLHQAILDWLGGNQKKIK